MGLTFATSTEHSTTLSPTWPHPGRSNPTPCPGAAGLASIRVGPAGELDAAKAIKAGPQSEPHAPHALDPPHPTPADMQAPPVWPHPVIPPALKLQVSVRMHLSSPLADANFP